MNIFGLNIIRESRLQKRLEAQRHSGAADALGFFADAIRNSKKICLSTDVMVANKSTFQEPVTLICRDGIVTSCTFISSNKAKNEVPVLNTKLL